MTDNYRQWTADEKMRREAKQLFKIEIIFRAGPETKILHLTNVLPAEFKQYRGEWFSIGFAWKNPVERGNGFIIPPFDIVSVEYWVQEKFFEP